MGSIFRLKNSWAIKYDEPGSTRDSRKRKQIGGFRTKSEASKALTEIENKINKNQYISNPNMTVNEMFEIWFKVHVSSLAKKTQINYKGLYNNYIKNYFKGIKLEELRPSIIIEFYNHLREVSSDDNTFKCHKTLRACLNKAYEWEYTDSKPLDRVTAPKEPSPDITYWKPNIIKSALDLFKDSEIYYHVYIALKTGLRIGEICALNKDSIDFENKSLYVKKTLQVIKGEIIIKAPKTENSIREIPLTDEMVDFFKKHITNIKKNKVFWGYSYNLIYDGYLSIFENGNIQHPDYVTKRFKKDIEYFGLPKVTFHDLRHSYASWQISKGTDMKTLQMLLGHASYKTTADTYAHINQELKRSAQERIG